MVSCLSSINKIKNGVGQDKVPVGRDWKHCAHHHAKTLVCFQSAITPLIIHNKQVLPPKSLSAAD